MGFGDVIKSVTNSATDLVKKEVEKNKLQKQQAQRMAQHVCTHLFIQSGGAQISAASQCIMRQRPEDGYVYFNSNENNLYYLIGYEWAGPVYDNIITSQTVGKSVSTTKKKGKSGKMLAGALVGTVASPVGTVVGAAVGAGGKSQSTTPGNTLSNMNQYSKQVEQIGIAVLKFERISDGSIISISVNCNTVIDAKIKCFQFKTTDAAEIPEQQKSNMEILQEIKALKELLDMGAITTDEFNSKKAPLLK